MKMTLYNARLITKNDETITLLQWRTAQHCAKLGHQNSQSPQHIPWLVRRQSFACRAKTCERMLRHRPFCRDDCAVVCILRTTWCSRRSALRNIRNRTENLH